MLAPPKSRSTSSTHPPSRTSSYGPSPATTPHLGNATPTSQQVLTALQVPKVEQDSLSGWLKNMIDKPKYAVFEARVVIQELGNVPQLEGKFEAGWKFRGRKPSGKEGASSKSASKKPSLPNMRLTPVHSLHPTPSLTSLRSTGTESSTAGSIASSPGIMLTRPSVSMSPAPSSTRLSMLRDPGHSSSVPIPSISASSSSSSLREPSSISKQGKMKSDPTPLRQSSKPQGSSSTLEFIGGEGDSDEDDEKETDSPQAMDLTPTTSTSRSRQGSDESAKSRESKSSPTSSMASRFSAHTGSAPHSSPKPHALTIDTGYWAARGVSGSSARSTSSMHSIPLSRGNSGIGLATRSGTAPSAATLLDPVPGKDDLPLLRPASMRSASTVSSSSTQSTQTISPVAAQPRIIPSLTSSFGQGSQSSQSRQNSRQQHHPQAAESSSSARKGMTPARALKQHTCEWKYTTTHTMRIPTGKSVPASGAATPGRRENAPILGNGPLSDSGYRLTIFEIRSTGSTSAAQPTGMDHNPLSVLAGVHTATHHPDRNASEGKHGGEISKGHKGERMLYGMVDIDLAPFAGKGRVGRRFLLKGSRTNATVRVDVEMRWVGGEKYWAAPPLQEGHHVTGLRDLVGDETASVHSDLALARNQSNSSSGSSSVCLSGSGPSRSASSLNLHALQNPSAVSLSGPAPKVDYKSYDHHLKPADAARQPGGGLAGTTSRIGATLSSLSRRTSRASPTPQTPPESPNNLFSPLSPFSPQTPLTPGATPDTPSKEGKEKDFFGTFGRRKTMHHHHSLHFRRHAFHGDMLSSTNHTNGHSNGHTNGHHRRHHKGLTELQPELIIEAIFNPRPAREAGPMTYVPHEDGGLGLELEPEDEVLGRVFGAEGFGHPGYTLNGGETNTVIEEPEPEETKEDARQQLGVNGGGGAGKQRMWGRMRARAQSARREKEITERDLEKAKEEGKDRREGSRDSKKDGSRDKPRTGSAEANGPGIIGGIGGEYAKPSKAGSA